MRVENTDLISTSKIGTDMSANITSSAIKIEHVGMMSISMGWSGNAAGDLKIQISNDVTQDPEVPSNWIDLDPSIGVLVAGLLNGDPNVCWMISDTSFRWFRIVFVRSGGAGTVQYCNMMTKGF